MKIVCCTLVSVQLRNFIWRGGRSWDGSWFCVALNSSGGLDENVPHRFMYSNICSPVQPCFGMFRRRSLTVGLSRHMEKWGIGIRNASQHGVNSQLVTFTVCSYFCTAIWTQVWLLCFCFCFQFENCPFIILKSRIPYLAETF